jgi:thymidine phosphorylase
MTSTVESVGMIVSSILSKKLAAGIRRLVLDVKVGGGAYQRTPSDADELCRMLAAVSDAVGISLSVFMSDMDQPLASSAGNALEVAYAVDYLTSRRVEPRFNDVVITLASEMLCLAGVAPEIEAARSLAIASQSSGVAAERFEQMVSELGGPKNILDCVRSALPSAEYVVPVPAAVGGRVAGVDTYAIGMAVVGIGGGRKVAGEEIDLSAGLTRMVAVGEYVGRGEPLAYVHANDAARAARACQLIQECYEVRDDEWAPEAAPLIWNWSDDGGRG